MSAKKLTPTEKLILEVLAARARLGEHFWTFEKNTTVTRALTELETKHYVSFQHGVAPDTYRVRLTFAGSALVLADAYQPPTQTNPRGHDILTGWVDEFSAFMDSATKKLDES